MTQHKLPFTKRTQAELDHYDTIQINSGMGFDTHKTCRRCHFIKSKLAFARKTESDDGLRAYCRSCARVPVNRVIITEKQCIRCKFTKPVEDFQVKNDAKDGYQSICKHCNKYKMREHTKRNRTREPVPPLKYRYCAKCKTTKSVNQFTSNVSTADHFAFQCKTCQAKWVKETGRLAWMSGYWARRKTDPTYEYTPGQIERTRLHRLAIEADPCHWCGQTNDKMVWAHITPLDQGGIDEPDNVVRSCYSCASTHA